MKKLFFLVLTVGALATAKAQITYGIKAGPNFSSLRYSGDNSNFSSKVGFHAGAFVGIPIADHFSVQPEVQYSGEGAKSKESDGEGGTVDVKYNLNYINIPIMAKYTLPVGVFFQTGPQIGFLASAKGKASGVSVDIKDGFKSTNFGWGLGAGYLSSIGVGIDLRYTLGLSNIAKDSGGESVKTGNFQVGVFYQLGGKK